MPEMRSPDGKVYDVADEDVAAMQRDQGWTLGTEAPAEPGGPTVKLKSKDGRLYQATPEEAAALQRDQDMVPASPGEVATREHERELYGKYGGTGQQALGLAEAFYRNASLGVISGLIGDEQEQRERAGVTREESPFLYAGASAAPALAAGIATGGAGLGVAGTIAAEGALGGLAAYGSESDAAFVEDRELSAEQAWGAFGKGALLGAGAAGAVMAGARALNPVDRALRNRFAEAAGKAERRAEKSAFRAVGIDDPVEGLADAVVKPVKAAEMRERGRAAAVQVREEFGASLQKLEEVEQAAQRWAPEAADVAGDAAAQRAAIRGPLDALRKDLEPIASPAEKGLVSKAFDMIDRSESPADLYTAVQLSRRAFADALGAAGDKATAQALERGVRRLDELEGNSALFGAPAKESAERAQALADLGDARQVLQERLAGGNYLEVTGMRAGKPVDEALDTYIERLGQVVSLSKGMPEAKEAKKALTQIQKLREGALREVAALNQADAISALDVDDVRPRGPSGTAAVLDIAQQVAAAAAAPQYMAYKVAKTAWKARKLASAAPDQRIKLMGDLALDIAGFADPIVGPARLAYKYRHHMAVLAETAREESSAAAKQMVSAARREGAEGIARGAARALGREKEAGELISRAKKLRGQRGYVDISVGKRNLQGRITDADMAAAKEVLPPGMTDEQFDRVMALDRFPGKQSIYLESDENTGKVFGLTVNNHFKTAGDSGSLVRTFVRRGKDRYVKHEVFMIPDGARGVGKDIINNSFDIYSKTGISRVEIDLATDVGRYLWPKMGFRAAHDAEEIAVERFLKEHPGFGKTIGSVEDIAYTEPGKQWLINTPGPWNQGLAIKLKPSKQAGNVTMRDDGLNTWEPLGDEWDDLLVGSLAGKGGTPRGGGGRITARDILTNPMGVVTAAGGAAYAAKSLAARYSEENFGEEQYNETRKAIELLQKDHSRLAEKLAGELGSLPTEAPELVMDLNARAATAVQFLASKLPPSYGFSLTYPDGPPPPKSDVVEMSLYMRGATQPSEVMTAIANGSAMPEEVEAFKAIYPKRFAMLQRDVHTEIQRANESGEVIPASRIATIETVLDMPGQLDPTFSDGIAVLAQTRAAEKREQRAASYVPPPRAGQRIEPSGVETP